MSAAPLVLSAAPAASFVVANRLSDGDMEARAAAVMAAAKEAGATVFESVEWNKYPIADALLQIFGGDRRVTAVGPELLQNASWPDQAPAAASSPTGSPLRVLEVGSGTGQHASFLSRFLSAQSQWQPTETATEIDVLKKSLPVHAAMNGVPVAAEFRRILDPAVLDAGVAEHWEELAARPEASKFDLAITANTLHIMPWPAASMLLQNIGHTLRRSAAAPPHDQPLPACLLIYGPFNYQGQFTTESNRRFDAWLKSRDSRSGIRNFEDVCAAAGASGLELLHDVAMPDNNRLLAFRKVVPKA